MDGVLGQYFRCVSLGFVILCFSACDGGHSSDSDSGNSNDTPSPVTDGGSQDTNTNQPGLAFNQTNTLGLLLGQTVANPATSASTGTITYSSGNTSVATVDDDGTVTAVALGTSTITAAQAADTNYEADTATVMVNVIAANFTLTAWIGKTNSEINFSTGVDGVEFYRSTDSDCNLASYAVCDFGQLDILNGTIVTDTAATASRSAFYYFVNGSDQADLTLATLELPYMGGPEVLVFDGRLFAVGGYTGRNEGGGNDVWVSDDGRHWAQLTDSAEFPERKDFAMAVFDNKLWLTGGYGADEFGFYNEELNDVWYSADGLQWTQAAAPPFVSRTRANLVNFNGKLWLIGGYEGTVTPLAEVWSSSNGQSWTQEVNNLPLEARHVVTFNNQIVAASVKGIWVSSNGVNWTELTTDTGYTRADAMVVHNGELYVMNNVTSSTPDEVWSSLDGVTWSKRVIAPAFNSHFSFAFTSFNNYLFVHGGASVFGTPVERHWYLETDSLDNDRWRRAMPGAEYPARTRHAGLSFNDKLWVIGGRSYSNYLNDVWSSTDGIHWTEEIAEAAFSARLGHQVIQYNGKLWLYGGANDSGELSDIWSSSDGVTWTSETADPMLATRYDYGLAVFNNTLFLLGGTATADDRKLGEVWQSSNGVDWTQAVASNFPARSDMGLTVYNGKLWMIGGFTGGNNFHNDVWYSDDGVSWTQATASAAFDVRANPQLYVHDGKLFVSSGDVKSGPTTFEALYNDVWSTTDGVDWTEENADAVFGRFYRNPVVELNGALWMLGGTITDDDFHNQLWRSTDGIYWRTPQQHPLNSPN